MQTSTDPLLTLEDLQKAKGVVDSSPYTVRTPLLPQAQKMFSNIDPSVNLYLKLENMQTTGSFKVRGVVNQLQTLPEGYGTESQKLISMSAGNYGKAFATITSQLNVKAMLLMPDTAPVNRVELIEGYGVEVERMPTNQLQPRVDKYVKEKKMFYLHPFDDIRILAGHGTTGLEILEDLPDPDVIVVCCGGGGLVSGVSAAVKLSGCKKCRIYAVEPEKARTMFESFRLGRATSMFPKSIASGLSPPYAGANCYKHCKAFVESVLLVSDEEIVNAMRQLYARGLVVEPSGAAAFAALLHGKVPDVKGKKVVVIITGGNVSAEEILELKTKFPGKKLK